MTERLFLEDPNRAHCLADVVDRRGRAVILTRSVLYGTSRAYGHEQPTDRGHLVIVGGNPQAVPPGAPRGGAPPPSGRGRKIKIARVAETPAGLVHHLEGDAPSRGASVQVHLDLPRRLLASHAHTTSHMVAHLTAPPRPAVPATLLAPPKVVGNGGVRVHLRGDATALLRRLRDLVQEDRKVTWRWSEPERAPAPDPWPPPHVAGPIRVVEIEGLGALPCDGTHARRTKEIRDIRGRERKRLDGTLDVELQTG